MSSFLQTGPELGNTYVINLWLKPYLAWRSGAYFNSFAQELTQLGERCRSEYLALALEAERNQPVHVPFDAWGKRIDDIRVSRAWSDLQRVAAREGLIAIGYERNFKEQSRVLQFAKLYLFHPSSAFFTCPLAMADGAARVLELYGKGQPDPQDALKHLITRNEVEFWTSGQWMTEKTGGSDVSETSTEARLDNGRVRLFGTKWFSSATSSQMALALARLPGALRDGKGLSLFMVKMRNDDGTLNNIKVLRLKDKLGTKALPTAELQLEGTEATQIGESGQGIKLVSTMLNITRLYNAICSCGQMARALDLLRDYAKKRKVFGKNLAEQPLHQMTFVHEELLHLTSFVLTMHLVELMGKEENNLASDSEKDFLRLLTPVCKLFTAKAAIHVCSEVIEGFGGAGYVEETGLAVHLRDAQVFPIWEGATNVLSLDVLRVLQKGSALESVLGDLSSRLAKLKTSPQLNAQAARYEKSLQAMSGQLQALLQTSPELITANMRGFSLYLARLTAGILLLEWAGANAQMIPWSEVWLKHNLGEWNLASSGDLNLIQSIM